MGYLTSDRKLTEKGIFATHIYFEELLVSEIFSSDIYKQLKEEDINCLIAAIIYEERRADKFKIKGYKKTLRFYCTLHRA